MSTWSRLLGYWASEAIPPSGTTGTIFLYIYIYLSLVRRAAIFLLRVNVISIFSHVPSVVYIIRVCIWKAGRKHHLPLA